MRQRLSLRLYLLLLLLLLGLVPPLLAAQAPSPAKTAIAGDWLVTTDLYGLSHPERLTLAQEGDKLTGDLSGDPLTGTLSGKTASFIAKGEGGDSAQYTGTFSGETISGRAVLIDGGDGSRVETTFTAKRQPDRPARPPQRVDFAPQTFYRQFSAATLPVLHLWPGDTLHTTTVDAAGDDAAGVHRVFGGNPQTGPFYIETALPGDVLAVHIDRLRLNRDWAISTDRLVSRVLTPQLAVNMKDDGKTVRWKLDRTQGSASLETPGEHLKPYKIPIQPMLGCLGVAPNFASAPYPTGDSGRFGGNMDWSDVREGATVYLPVSQPGALLYLGDGHAQQGDGELNGDALETSLEVEITVDVLRRKSISTPRLESATHLMTVGLAGSLDEAMRTATASLGQWLEEQYGLTPAELAEVLGTGIELSINEVADRNVGVVAKIRKERLAVLAPTTKPQSGS